MIPSANTALPATYYRVQKSTWCCYQKIISQCVHYLCKKEKKNVYYYTGLAKRIESESDLEIPAAFSIRKIENGDTYELCVHTLWEKSKHALSYTLVIKNNIIPYAYFGATQLDLDFFGIQTSDVWSPINSNRLSILVYIMSRFDRCKGCQADCLKNSRKEMVTKEQVWGSIFQDEESAEIHSGNCFAILDFTSRGSACKKCSETSMYNTRNMPLCDITNINKMSKRGNTDVQTAENITCNNSNGNSQYDEFSCDVINECENSKSNEI